MSTETQAQKGLDSWLPTICAQETVWLGSQPRGPILTRHHLRRYRGFCQLNGHEAPWGRLLTPLNFTGSCQGGTRRLSGQGDESEDGGGGCWRKPQAEHSRGHLRCKERGPENPSFCISALCLLGIGLGQVVQPLTSVPLL